MVRNIKKSYHINMELKRVDNRIRKYVEITQFSDFKHFKTETYVYWRFKLISLKENMTVAIT